jgi:crossover junction endodeoxyribonuclease RuvC
VPVNEFAPAEIKKAVVGTGVATKEQVQFMLTRLLRLKSVPQPSDAADGVAAALACLMGANLPRIDGGGRIREPSRPALLSSPASPRRP